MAQGDDRSGLGMSDHEACFAAVVDAKFAVAFRYARTGLGVALRSLGLQAGDRVALSPLTCRVVPLAILAADLEPLYVDVDRATLNLRAENLGEQRSPGAVVFQHTYGLGGGLEGVLNVAEALEVPVIEDCAQVLPGRRAAGPRGIAAIYSNNVGKPMPAGSGGVMSTSDVRLLEAARSARSRMRAPGAPERARDWLQRVGHRFVTPRTYWWVYDAYRAFAGGYGKRPIQARIAAEIEAVEGPPTVAQERLGRSMLGRLSGLAAHRQDCVRRYRDSLGASEAVQIPGSLVEGPLYYFPVLTERKAEVLALARKQRVEIVPWPRSTPIYPVDDWAELAELGYERGMCPNAEWLASRLVGLPTHAGVRPSHIERMVAILSDCAG